jgi:hypothetical protein
MLARSWPDSGQQRWLNKRSSDQKLASMLASHPNLLSEDFHKFYAVSEVAREKGILRLDKLINLFYSCFEEIEPLSFFVS